MKKPLMEGCPRQPFKILESKEVERPNGSKAYRMTGVLQNYEDVNLNRRKYPRSIWEGQLNEGSEFYSKLQSRLALGHIEHPEDGITRLDKVAIAVTEARIATDEDIANSNGVYRAGDIIGTLEILETHEGKVLKALTDASIPWGVSSRGNGSIEESSDCDIVANDFILECWDAVFSPSVARAIPSLMSESADKLTASARLLESTWSPTPAPAKAEPPAPAPAPAPAPTPAAAPSPSPVPAPVRENHQNPPPTPTKTMSKLAEMRSLKTDVTQLQLQLKGSLKNLKASDKAGLFERIDETRQKVGALVAEDPSVKALAEDIYGRLNLASTRLDEDEDEFDGPPAPGGDAPPAAAAAPEAPPEAPPAPPEEGEGADEEEVLDTLQSAADTIRELAGEENPEAEAVAAKLDSLADRVSSIDADAEGMEDVDVDKLPYESRRVIKGYQRRNKVLESQIQRMGTAAVTLLGKHKKLQESTGKSEGHTLAEWKQAAKDLAKKYNAECVSLGRSYLKAKRPDLYEAHKDKLEAITNHDKFTAFVETIVKTPVKPVTESAPPAPGKPASTPAAPKPPAPAPLGESVHPGVALANAQRAYRK